MVWGGLHLLINFVCMCVCMWSCACIIACAHGIQYNLWESLLSFYHVVLGIGLWSGLVASTFIHGAISQAQESGSLTPWKSFFPTLYYLNAFLEFFYHFIRKFCQLYRVLKISKCLYTHHLDFIIFHISFHLPTSYLTWLSMSISY